MPRNVTMQRPHPRVVLLELKDHISVARNDMDVAAQRVGGVDGIWRAGVGTRSGLEDEHVVAVEMDGVGRGNGIVDDDTDGAVGAEVVNVPLGRIGV